MTSFFSRFLFSFVAWLRIVVDARFAQAVQRCLQGREIETEAALLQTAEPKKIEPPTEKQSEKSAYVLLQVFQREGRLIDFLQQDLQGFSDEDVGAASRVVHEGCQAVLKKHCVWRRIRKENEGTKIQVLEQDLQEQVILSGELQGHAPFTGELVHAGWYLESLMLPERVAGSDPKVIAPAQVEMS